ncbi:DUF5689 domain-containing protein [Pseudotenacibaculum sp. MALMAid0570]|uniref:DUF5689 domain-containing protein n=1 Tax=Pseudotenacibaculum sp. MALMAid0570 TaxID=3143938 RepID=UPI0032DE731C
MRKNYFLTLLFTLCLSAFSFGQVILAEGFSYSDGNLVPNGGWTNFSGTASEIQVASGQAVMSHGSGSREDASLTFATVAGDIYYAFNLSIDDLGSPVSGSDSEYFANFLEGTSNYRARMDIVPPSGAGDYSIGIASNSSTAEATWGTDLTFGQSYRVVVKFDQVTGTAQLWVDPTVSTDTSISGSAIGAFTVDQFALRQSNSSSDETIRIDDLMVGQTFNDVLVFSVPTNPTISIGGISTNQIFNPETTEVTPTLSISNFTLSADAGGGVSDNSGDGYIATVLQETGQADENASFFTTTPPAITVVAGRSYTITAELVDNSGNSLSPAVSASVSFSVASYAQVADIAALRAGTEGNYYELTGEAIMTFDAMNSRNQKYIEDGTAAILIDDDNGTITTSYNVGDGITGIKGQLSSFSGVLQFVPQVDPGAASTTGNAITPQVVTIADLNANLNDYESEWITINNVTFTDGDGVATFAASTNYDITEGGNTLVFRSAFSTADFIGNVIPTGTANVTGPAAEFNGTAQIFGTSSANIVLSVQQNEIEGYSAYPNPVKGNNLTVTTNSIDKKEVVLFNVLGRKVFTQSFTGTRKTLDITGINSGIYILKVTQGTKVATQKIIIE